MRAVLPNARDVRLALLAVVAALAPGLSACSASGDGSDLTLANMPPDLAVDPFLWEGTLETLKFLPFTKKEPSTGRIETGWGSLSGEANEQVRAIVQILPGPVTHASVSVTVYRQVNGHPAAVAPTTGTTVQEAILLRARQLKNSIQTE